MALSLPAGIKPLDQFSRTKSLSNNSVLGKYSNLKRSLANTWTATKRWSIRLRRLSWSAKDTIHNHLDPIIAHLPPELIDQIVDYLHDDRSTLMNLSLVCHALVPPTRYHLFERLKITIYNVKNLSTLLANEAPEIALYVRELTLEAGEGRSDQVFRELRGLLVGKELRTLLRTFFLLIAPRTRNVVRLVLKAVPLDKNVVDMLSPCFPQLNTLSLFDCSFRCNADLDKLMRDHPAIHSLRAGRVCSIYGMTSPDPGDTIGPRLPLRQLKVTEAYSRSPLTLMPWLVTHCSPQHFVFTLYRLGQFNKVNTAIGEMDSLTHLHLILYRWRREDMDELETTPSLVSLMPRYPPLVTTITLDGKMHMLNLVVTVLSQLDPHAFVHLRTLYLWVHLEETDVSKVDAVTWAGMDQTLSVLLSLGAVNFYNSCLKTDHIHEGSEAIETRLPILNIRRMLRFQDLQAPF